MRENRTYGSEGGAELITRFLPLYAVTASQFSSEMRVKTRSRLILGEMDHGSR